MACDSIPGDLTPSSGLLGYFTQNWEVETGGFLEFTGQLIWPNLSSRPMRGLSQKTRRTPRVILWLLRAQAEVHVPTHERAYTRAHTCKHNTYIVGHGG